MTNVKGFVHATDADANRRPGSLKRVSDEVQYAVSDNSNVLKSVSSVSIYP